MRAHKQTNECIVELCVLSCKLQISTYIHSCLQYPTRVFERRANMHFVFVVQMARVVLQVHSSGRGTQLPMHGKLPSIVVELINELCFCLYCVYHFMQSTMSSR
jgi:hypothetical protein